MAIRPTGEVPASGVAYDFLMRRASRVSACVALALILTLFDRGAGAQAPAMAEVLISRQLAEAYRITPGAAIQLSQMSSGAGAHAFTVVGVYEPTPNPMEINDPKYKVRLHLHDLQESFASEDPLESETVDQVNIVLAKPSDAAAFSRDLMARVPATLARPVERATNASTFVVLERFHLAIAMVTIFASTVFLLALSVMLVDERRETVGVLRLIGLTSRRVLLQVFLEGFVIAVGGSLFGLLLALGSEVLINRYFQWHYNTALIFVRVTPRVALECVLIAVPLGVVASVTASWMLLRRQVMSLARR